MNPVITNPGYYEQKWTVYTGDFRSVEMQKTHDLWLEKNELTLN